MNFVENGFAVLPAVLSGSQCESAVGSIQGAADDRVGSRALLSEVWCRTLARSLRLHRALATLLPVNAVAVQCTLFEKSPQRNWLVSLHQDLSIPVQERVVSDELSGGRCCCTRHQKPRLPLRDVSCTSFSGHPSCRRDWCGKRPSDQWPIRPRC